MKATPWILTISVSVLGLGASAVAQTTPPIEPKLSQSVLPGTIVSSQPETRDPRVPVGPLTLTKALSIALSSNQALEVARQNLLAARGRTRQSGAALNPPLGFSGTYQSVTDFKSSSGNAATAVLPGYGATLTLNQLLFDSNVSKAQLRQARALE